MSQLREELPSDRLGNTNAIIFLAEKIRGMWNTYYGTRRRVLFYRCDLPCLANSSKSECHLKSFRRYLNLVSFRRCDHGGFRLLWRCVGSLWHCPFSVSPRCNWAVTVALDTLYNEVTHGFEFSPLDI